MTHAVRPFFIGSEIYRNSSYGGKHPLAIPRVSTLIDLIRALGWLDPAAYVESPCATPDQLLRFHAPDYIAALMAAEAAHRASPEIRRRYKIGANGNPVFPEVFRRPATACGGTLRAAVLLRGGGIVYNPAGGTHHGRRGRASGFCYLNDPVLGILAMLDAGLRRIYYVDVDAHHCDGVQDAFADDDRVFTVSVHEAGRWPCTGAVADRAGGWARNLPVPSGLNDAEMAAIVAEALMPLGEDFRPEAVVLQCGADALADDPMSGLELSNGALWAAVRAMRGLAPRLLVLGGGGYNPWAVARCWAGAWAVLNDIAVPARLSAAAERVLRAIEWRHSRGRNPPPRWFTTMADAPNVGPVRAQVRAIIAEARRP